MRRLAHICMILVCVAQGYSAFRIMEDPVPLYTKGFQSLGDAESGSLSIDTFNVHTPSSPITIRRIKGARNFKGPNDDTLRLFVVQSASPRKALMFTDTASQRFSAFRVDTLTPTLGFNPQGLAAGDLDGDGYTEVYIGTFGSNPQRLYRIRWNGGYILDSISFDVQDSIFNLAIGDCDNDGYNELLIPGDNRLFVLNSWVGDNVVIDTISVSGRVTAVAVGDVHPDKPGNEMYVATINNFYMIYREGDSYSVTEIYQVLQTVHSMAIGDVDPLREGQELVLVHGGTNYQVSLWNWNSGTNEFDGRAWKVSSIWTSSLVNNPADVAVGDISEVSLGDEVVLASGSAGSQNAPSYIFWISRTGTAYKMELPEPTAGRAECGAFIDDINKFSSRKLEFVLTGGASSGRVVLYQERGVKDLEVVSVRQTIPVIRENREASFDIVVRNKGEISIDSLRISYYHWISDMSGVEIYNRLILPSQQCTLRLTPSLYYQFPGPESLFVTVDLPDDATPSDNEKRYYFEIWPDSTVAASNFNSPEDFPPVGWSTEILQDTFNWGWYDTCVVVNWGGRYLAAPVFEGRGVAGYPSHEAARGSSARLITNPFNIGSARKRVVLNFYMLRSKFLYFDYLSEDSLMVEYLIDGDYVPVTVLYRVDTTLVDSSASWQRYTVVIGDFPADTTISVSFRAFGEGGLNMFIDSVLIFTTAPGPEFDFNLNSDIGKYQNSDNYWVRIRPYGSPYPIEACSLYYRILNKSFTAVPMDSTDEETGYFYFTIPNDDPALDKNVEFYFEFFEGLPWMYANRYPSTGTISYTILPVADKIPTSFSFGLLNSRITQGNFDFTYAVPVRSNVEICVYSVTGQRVATLVSGIKDPGYYTVKWDGRSNSGSRLPSGVYFVKMVTPEKSFTQRVLIGR
ncbi:MAG: FlgD immunoglobulin-like domain containing protein [candidate division WOR-3 bacterium]